MRRMDPEEFHLVPHNFCQVLICSASFARNTKRGVPSRVTPKYLKVLLWLRRVFSNTMLRFFICLFVAQEKPLDLRLRFGYKLPLRNYFPQIFRLARRFPSISSSDVLLVTKKQSSGYPNFADCLSGI